MKDNILDDFNNQKPIFDSFRDRVGNLLKDLLDESGISIHQLSHRTKDFDSLSKKIDTKQGKYKTLNDVTDIVGIRIITYLESDVDKIKSLIETEFKPDEENSIDKRKLKIDQFGYKSVHTVVSLNDFRCKLSEYKKYANLKCEIQIRSILQHAWAEIEHDLGYKSTVAIPEISKRNFNRLAALLETADLEFDRLKKELSNYEQEIPKLIISTPEEVSLNQASLNSFIETNEVLQECKNIIRDITNANIYDAGISTPIIERFDFFEIHTIKELGDLISENENEFLAFVAEFMKGFSYEELPSYLPIFYFQHFLAAKSEDTKILEDYFSITDPPISNDDNAAEKMVEFYKKVKKT